MPHDTPGAIASKEAMEQRLNGEVLLTLEQGALYEPRYYVYIFNVGPLEHTVEKGSAGKFRILACEAGARHSEPLRLPTPFVDTFVVEQERKTHIVTGEFMAQDIVHPAIGANWSFGQNLDDFGVFWTKNATPSDAEIRAARGKMEVTFRKLLEMANRIETTGKLDEITPLMRIAASYFNEDRPWNRIYKRLSECPGCGEAAKPGIIKHTCGYVFDWDRALLAGMVTPEQHRAVVSQLKNEPRSADATPVHKSKKS